MGLFSQFANVVEWEEWNEEMIFWKWKNEEIKKGSRLILRPGQDAIFLYNGRIEGIFTDDGDYDIESQIIPFLSTLKGFKFGFNSGLRAEVLFVNTKEFLVKWGTKGPVNIPSPNLPGGLPVRANGTFTFKVNDYITLIDKIAGTRRQYLVSDLKERIISILNQLLMKWISKEGKDMFNLQANAYDIAKGIQTDLDMEIIKSGITITGFNIMNFNYPEEIQNMITKTASHSMIGNMGTYAQVSMADGMSTGKGNANSTASDMAGMMMGMQVAKQVMGSMDMNFGAPATPMSQPSTTPPQAGSPAPGSAKPNFCPNCGAKTGEGNFCSNCGLRFRL